MIAYVTHWNMPSQTLVLKYIFFLFIFISFSLPLFWQENHNDKDESWTSISKGRKIAPKKSNDTIPKFSLGCIKKNASEFNVKFISKSKYVFTLASLKNFAWEGKISKNEILSERSSSDISFNYILHTQNFCLIFHHLVCCLIWEMGRFMDQRTLQSLKGFEYGN